jgi:hypothetical protein
MKFIGTFWRQKPTTSANHVEWAWCNIWVDDRGEVAFIEWHR